MKLRLPYILRNAVLAALLCCTMAFGTVTVTVNDQDSSLEKLTGAPSGSVSIVVEGEDAILGHALTLDSGADHYIIVEKGHSLTIMGGLTYNGNYLGGGRILHLFEKELGNQDKPGGKIIFAAGESKLGTVWGGPGEIVVQNGAKVTISDDITSRVGILTIEKGGEMSVADLNCTSLNGSGTLTLRKNPVYGFSSFFIDGAGGNFSGRIEGEEFIEVGSLFNPSKPSLDTSHQTFTDVTSQGTNLSVACGNVALAGAKDEFKGLQLGSVHDISFDTWDNPDKLQTRSTLTMEEGTKVSLGKLLDAPTWHYDEESDSVKFDSRIYEPVRQRGLSFDMEDRSTLVVKYGKGEMGAKITASGAIVLKTTTWEEDTSNPTKLTVRVEFAENHGKDLKQLLIQANGIVLTSIEYGEHDDGDRTFSVTEQYTDVDSESKLNGWLKENVTVTVDGYDDPYLMVEKKDGNVVQLYVIAGDGANLPDAPIEPIPDDPNPDTIFAPLAISENTRTGAGMLYHAMNYSTSSELRNVAGVIAELAQIGQGGQPAVAMAAMIAESGITERLIEETNIDPAAARSEAQRLMSAVVGSAVPALGAAQRDAMRGQLSRAASRAARLGQEPAARDDSDQGMRVWVEGMGGSAKLDRSGDETGYEHNSWGAGVGVEKDLQGGGPIIGLSLVASYGDLKVDAADHAEGDLDTYYVNLYAHHRSGNFHHSFVVSAGFSDAEFNRTIRGGVAPYVLDYATSGSTNGAGFGAAYELAYDISLNEQKSSLLQPLIGLSVITTKMDGYNENGAGDAGLHVGEQKSTLTTLTAGARFVSQCGEQTFSRAAVLEIRANVAVDMGDRRSEADVSFLGDRGYSGRVRSAETGVVGAQLGASVSIPVDRDTLLYVNGEADLRSGSNSWSVGGGVSIAF